jgi:predicted transcriptional regulator YheO
VLRKDELRALALLGNAIGQTFGPYCDMVTDGLDSIVEIANGHVTGRKACDQMPDRDSSTWPAI